jgi:DNA-binding CsgD family transcriptional regulator
MVTMSFIPRLVPWSGTVEERTIPLRYDPSRPLERVSLLLGRGAAHGIVVELGGAITIGREDGVTLLLAMEGVSRRHAAVMPRGDDGFVVSDLGSTNGTLVNGETITQPRVLASGDLIQIGAAELEFRVATRSELERARRVANACARLRLLSERELEVARLVAEGLRSAEIGRRLHIGVRTVNTHLEHIYERLGIRSRLVLTRLVLEAAFPE